MNRQFAVIQIGARRQYAVPAALERLGWLGEFHTDISTSAWYLRWMRVMPQALTGQAGKALMSRREPSIPRGKVRTYPLHYIRKRLTNSSPAGWGHQLRMYAENNAEFCREVIRRGLGGVNAVYVFNAAGLEILEYARQRGMFCVVDQTAAPWRFDEQMLAEERERWPGWEPALVQESDWQLLSEREHGEWRLADVIINGSEYAAEAVAREGGPAVNCRVLPTGVDVTRFSVRVRRRTGALKVLFLGTLQLRKGIQYFHEAARTLHGKDFEFRAVGPVRVSGDAVIRMREAIAISPAVERDAVASIYDWADVLVLPTLSEGSSNVCFEALACGLPLVTTRNAGSTIRDGIEGFVTPLRNSEAIVERLRRLQSDPVQLESMSLSARKLAESFSWTRYETKLAEILGTEGMQR